MTKRDFQTAEYAAEARQSFCPPHQQNDTNPGPFNRPLPPPFTMEELTKSYKSLPAADLPPVVGEKDDEVLANGGTQFSTGAVRSADKAGVMYHLISPIGLRRLAETYKEGFDKYGAFNWERGMPIGDILNHAIAHIYAFLSGVLSGEDELAHAAWNLIAAMHMEETHPELVHQLRFNVKRKCECCGKLCNDTTKGSTFCGECDGGLCNGKHEADISDLPIDKNRDDMEASFNPTYVPWTTKPGEPVALSSDPHTPVAVIPPYNPTIKNGCYVSPETRKAYDLEEAAIFDNPNEPGKTKKAVCGAVLDTKTNVYRPVAASGKFVTVDQALDVLKHAAKSGELDEADQTVLVEKFLSLFS